MKLFVFATLKNLKKIIFVVLYKIKPSIFGLRLSAKKSITIAKIKFKWGKYSKLSFREND